MDVKKDVLSVKVKQTETDEAMKTVKKDVKSIKQKVESVTNNTKESVMSEVNQRETRQKNIIIHGLKESEIEGAANREAIFAEETATLNNMFSNMQLDATDISESVKFRRRMPPNLDPFLLVLTIVKREIL